jgi:hypothetical protein
MGASVGERLGKRALLEGTVTRVRWGNIEIGAPVYPATRRMVAHSEPAVKVLVDRAISLL